MKVHWINSSQVQPAPAAQEAEPRSPVGAEVSARLHDATIPSLSLQGKYSIERMLALEEYSRTKSYWQVVWTVIWTPFVPVLMILAYQLPPLAPPEAGLQANWVYVVERCGLGAYVVYAAILMTTNTLMPELERVLTRRRRFVLCGILVGVYVSLTVALAHWWGFPVPFSASIVNPTTGIICIPCVYTVVRPILKQSPQLQRRFALVATYAMVTVCASLGYPAYIGLFVYVGDNNPNFQPLVTVLALAIKLMLRKIIAYAVQEWEDLIPVMVIFSVEFFSSLYQVVSVQASTSLLTTVFIIALDFTSTATSQWKLYKSTEALQGLLQDTEADALLPVVADLCEAPDTLRATSADILQQLRAIHVFSSHRNGLRSIETQRRLENVNEAQIFRSTQWEGMSLERTPPTQPSHQRADTLYSALHNTWISRNPSRIADSAPKNLRLTKKSRRVSAIIIAQDKQRTAIVEATAALFRTEVMLLTEYLECMIPFFYAVNMAFIWLSPNAHYYPLTGSLTTPGQLLLVLVNIAVLFVVEVASLVFLNWMLRKRLRFSPMHQVGFVMETHASIIRANMLFVLVMVLHLNLAHTGVDFSFQFKWLHANDTGTINT